MHPLYEKTLKTLEFDQILLKLIEHARSEGAKKMAAELMPHLSLDEAKNALSETSDALNILLRRSSPPIFEVRHIGPSMARANKGAPLSNRELLEVAGVLKGARLLISYRGEEEHESSLDRYFFALTANRTLEELIFAAIIDENEMADDASPELYSIRRKIRLTHEKIRDSLQKIVHSKTHEKHLQDAIITQRDGRYVVPVKQEYRSEIAGVVHDTSSSGQTLFVEPMAVVAANNELRTLHADEKREMERILFELSMKAAEISGEILCDYENIVMLDFIFAKAKLSREFDGSAPELNDDGIIDLRRARHPLIDKKVVVPVDVRLGRDFDTLVVTGPNTGGKTVTLKTLGLFCAMAAAGLHIPCAEGSMASVFQNIFADIGDEQSIAQSLSTFSSHMKTIVSMLEAADYQSFLLFDELGAGTDPTEGAALAISIIEHVRGLGARCAATTHYSEIKLYALATAGVENASCEFDVASLRPTYRLLIGIPGKSNAFAISEKLGLRGEIIEQAKRQIKSDDIAFEDVLMELEKSRQNIESEKEEIERLKRESGELKSALSDKKDHYEKTREQAINQAKAEAKRIIAQAKATYEMTIKELEELKKEKNKAEFNQNLMAAKTAIKTKINEAENALGSELKMPKKPQRNQIIKEGDSVYLLNLDKPATVISKPDKNGNMTVLAGIMKFSVNRDMVRLAVEAKDSVNKVSISHSVKKGGRDVKQELDLRGFDREEALLELERYLDDAVLMNLEVVTIIHGKGTGALRSAVSDALKGHRNVRDYRLGRYGEGEMGVTVVTLK